MKERLIVTFGILTHIDKNNNSTQISLDLKLSEIQEHKYMESALEIIREQRLNILIND